MTAGEVAEYQALDHVEPWGEQRADLRMGILASTAVNMMKGKKGKRVKATDFMPYLDVRGAADKAASKARALSGKVKAMFKGKKFD